MGGRTEPVTCEHGHTYMNDGDDEPGCEECEAGPSLAESVSALIDRHGLPAVYAEVCRRMVDREFG